ncbi:iron-containing alcohol dehydrogenase [Rhizobium mayense]|uniref:Iron-containing alcohol dehydrogenase n=1 Tax=Rhizobium mayense TaxID=1312184 RepID=A0ABT7K4V4_9HYPH|nr:iron-containing alcohol dehydrogenase [Rhizobium mayense]MDL2403650.1 iron-containing alcohol dehydrogenase [Rhizobium mayense]
MAFSSSRDELSDPAHGRHDTLPTRSVIWGAYCRSKLAQELDRIGGSRVTLLTTASLARHGRHVGDLVHLIGERHVRTVSDLPAHVPVEGVEMVTQSIEHDEADTLIAFGGGSVIDAAKAVAGNVGRKTGRIPPIIAFPTTLSGAEFAHVYGVLEITEKGPFKRTYSDPGVVPQIVFLDPELTLSTPQTLWLSSGIKALDHAIEGLLIPGKRPVTDAVALEGIARMARALPQARSPALAERLDAQLAAWMSYFAPATIRAGLSHRIGYILGGSYQVPHSLTSCITLAPVMRMFAKLEPAKLTQIGAALGLSSPNPAATASAIDRLVGDLGLPQRLRDLGIEKVAIPRIAALTRHHFPADCERVEVLGANAFDDLILSLW